MARMSILGQFLEFSVPAADPAASLEFYRRLGFSEIRVNDVRPGNYAAVTDGQIVIGLHGSAGPEAGLRGGTLDEPALTFVRPGLAAHARALVDSGVELVHQRLDDDQFHEIRLRSPGGHLLQLLEAPTFSVTDEDHPAPVIGRCIRLELGCDMPEATQLFFEQGGFLGSGVQEPADAADEILLAVPGLLLALVPSRAGGGIAPLFEPGGAWQSALVERGFATRRTGQGSQLVAPEGTLLRLMPGS